MMLRSKLKGTILSFVRFLVSASQLFLFSIPQLERFLWKYITFSLIFSLVWTVRVVLFYYFIYCFIQPVSLVEWVDFLGFVLFPQLGSTRILSIIAVAMKGLLRLTKKNAHEYLFPDLVSSVYSKAELNTMTLI